MMDNSTKSPSPYAINNARYQLDFVQMPQNANPQFIQNCLTQKERFLCEIFNSYYSGINPLFYPDHPKSFREDEFTLTNTQISATGFILYITLPVEHDGSLIYCSAYAFSYERTLLDIKNVRFFTIEQSDMGTACIGSITANGGHINYGQPAGSVEGDLTLIRKILQDI